MRRRWATASEEIGWCASDKHVRKACENGSRYLGEPRTQELLSLATQELVRDQLPGGTSLRYLGEHRLKDLFREQGDKQSLAYCLNNLGMVAYSQGDLGRAALLTEEGVALVRELGARVDVALGLCNLGWIALLMRKVHTAGFANLRTDRPIRVNDHMRIASTAKAFSGAVALSLVSKGALSLNDTIGDLLPNLPRSWHEITLRQLLNHSSGLPDFSLDPRFQRALGVSPKKAPPPEMLLSYIKNKDPLFDPGSRYRYSNSDNIAVALMVESATNRHYERQLQKQVYGPLGLEKTTLPRGPNLEKPYIHGYDNEPPRHPPKT